MHVEDVVVVEGAVPVDAIEEVVPTVGGVVAVGVGVHGVEVLRHVIEVDDESVERDSGIIPPQVLVVWSSSGPSRRRIFPPAYDHAQRG